MNNSTSPACPRCGAPIAAGAAAQLCPACLMSGALASPDAGDFSLGEWPPPAPFAPREFPHEFGDYRLLGVLGSGGMGTVYEAEQRQTGRRVALKMLAQQLDSPQMQQRFLREGRLAASINHVNSLYIFGSEEIDAIPVISMEIAAAGTLGDRLEKRGPFAVREAVDAILDVISGLEAASAAGVLHRDVKPSNCFVGGDGAVKVGDFGLSVSTLARDDADVTAAGVIMGTPAFAPPEQLRGDELDLRADIYSVGATLFTLLTGRAPFEGKNAVQVVVNAMNQEPKALRSLRDDVPPGLEQVVARCLAKQPAGRYADHMALRNALLPFSSREPEPAPMTVRAAAGWVDYLIAFLVPYVVLMLAIGNEAFHFRLFMERTVFSARHHIALLCIGVLYFAIAEGVFGGGPGKRLKGLRVVRGNRRRPGVGRALVRILIPILGIECVRLPLLLATITATRIDDLTTAQIVIYSVATGLCPWIPVAMALCARRENGFATLWDLVSGTRVVVKAKGSARATVEPAAEPKAVVEGAAWLGPYRVTGEVVAGKWIAAADPVLRRSVWLLRRTAAELPLARRDLARPGRLRWLQAVVTPDATWDAFEATPGVPLSSLVAGGKRPPWSTLRHWLHDLATELWSASADRTLPAAASLDQVLISTQGHAVLLDEPWPAIEAPAERMPIGDLAGQQRFLSAVAGWVESTSLPLHARPVLRNLATGKFEKLSFLTGILRGLLEKPAEVSRGIRAGSIFLIPVYAWILVLAGCLEGAAWLYAVVGDTAAGVGAASAIAVLAACAVIQFTALPLRTTAGHATFRLAVVDARGEPAGVPRLLLRWAIVWLPLLISIGLLAMMLDPAGGGARLAALVLLLAWIGAAAHAAIHPVRGIHDRLARTWVVRR